MSEVLKCHALRKSFGDTKALDNVNLSIGPGKIVGLLGPNGAGKTTLIKMANGLLQPSSGELWICGKKPGVETKKIVSYLPDRIMFADWMTVGDVIDMYTDFYADFNRTKAEEMCVELELAPKRLVKNLSKGTQEKMQIMLVMSRNARLYLLDEPIGGVDPAAREFILKTIVRNYNPEASVIISTHLISDVEALLDEAVFLQNGKVLLADSVDNIREERGMSVDELFREMFRVNLTTGGEQ